MTQRIWETRPDGSVAVDGVVTRLAGDTLMRFRLRAMRWAHCTATASACWHVPWHWVLGIIWAESGGEPGALSGDGGYGLMQLTSPGAFFGVAPEDTRDGLIDPFDDVLDPARNIALGTRLLADIQMQGNDLIATASCYNAGMTTDGMPHASEVSPWGYRETPGFIERVVAAANTALGEMHYVPGCYTAEYIRVWQGLLGINGDGKFGPNTLAASRSRLP